MHQIWDPISKYPEQFHIFKNQDYCIMVFWVLKTTPVSVLSL